MLGTNTFIAQENSKNEHNNNIKSNERNKKVRPLKWGLLVEYECTLVARFHLQHMFHSVNQSCSFCLLSIFVLAVE